VDKDKALDTDFGMDLPLDQPAPPRCAPSSEPAPRRRPRLRTLLYLLAAAGIAALALRHFSKASDGGMPWRQDDAAGRPWWQGAWQGKTQPKGETWQLSLDAKAAGELVKPGTNGYALCLPIASAKASAGMLLFTVEGATAPGVKVDNTYFPPVKLGPTYYLLQLDGDDACNLYRLSVPPGSHSKGSRWLPSTEGGAHRLIARLERLGADAAPVTVPGIE
jgi:hypothetical protein